MKNSLRVFVLPLAFAGWVTVSTHHGMAGDEPAAPQATPVPVEKAATPPQPAVAPTPATVIVAGTSTPTPSPVASSAAAQLAAPPQISFNAENKNIAKRIYQSMRDIQDTEFDPAANIGAITKLQDEIAQTDFSAIPQIEDYVKDSLTLNTLRSKDIKIQRADTGKSAKENGNKTGVKIDAGMFTVSGGVEDERTNAQRHENQSSSDVSISSQNDPAVLDKVRHQQATSYGLLLNELKKLGFARPTDAKSIYGRWKWRCNEDAATYEFDFRKDGTVYVKLKADNPERWVGHGFVNKGRGEWKLDYRSLSLEMSDVNLAGFWKQHALIFFAGKEIVSIDDEKMIIAGDEDNELKKIPDDPKK